MIIKFYAREIYGNETLYAADHAQAEAIRMLTGQKTLTHSTIEGLKGLGHEFEQVANPKAKGIPATMYHIFDK